jgi:hypothetical protein
VASCSGGLTVVTNNGKTCTMSWPQSLVSSTVVTGSSDNGGSITGVCTASGWQEVHINCGGQVQ